MPGPGFPVANKILYKYEQDRAYRLHRQKVNSSRSTVDIKKPRKYPHLILQLKKIQLEEERQAEVDHENKLLLQKMTKIMKERAMVDSWNGYQTKSLNLPAREKQLREIQMENIGLAKRLEQTQPVIKTDELEDEYQQKKYLQMLWNENAKDYDMVIPRHHRYRQLRRIKEAQQERKKEEEGSEDKADSLPPIKPGSGAQSIRYNADTYRSSKSDSGDKDRKSEDDTLTDRSHFNSQVDNDAKALFKVAKELAQPEDVFIKNLVRRTQKQRMQIKDRFKEMYGLDLVSELNAGLCKDWENLISALLKNRNVGTANALNDALEEGDYSSAVEILFTCRNSELSDLKEVYRKEYSVSLESTIHDKSEDPERTLLLTLLKGGRPEESAKLDEKVAETDANDLYESGDGRWTDDSGKFMKILKSRNNKHMRVVLNLYKVNNKGTDITEDITHDCSKTYAEALVALVNCLRGSENYYADKLFKSMSPTDPAFVNLMVERSDIDMPNIRKAYKKKYDAELADDIRHKCGHTTTRVLIEIANKTPQNWPKAKHDVNKRVTLPPVTKRIEENGFSFDMRTKTVQQKKWSGANVVTHQSRPPVKRQDVSKESKTRNNPLSQPSMRIAADASIQRKEEEKHKELEMQKKKEEERQKKNISGTIKPSNNFNPVSDCERLKEALSGLNTDESTIIDILPCRSNGQRQILQRKWEAKYKSKLAEVLKSKLSGDFEEVIIGLMMTPTEYDAYCLHEALEGMGLSDANLIGILCTRDSKEMKDIKEQFKKDYNKDLEQELTAHVDPELAQFLIQLSKGERDQGTSTNPQDAKKEANTIHKAGKLNVSDSTFRNLVLKKNHAQVKLTFQEYQKLVENDIYQSIADAVVGETEEVYISLVKAIEDPVEFYADRLGSCFSGLGTNDNMLTRIVISRSELDLRDIKARYQQNNKKSLSAMVKAECSGDFKDILLAILGDS